MKKEVRYTLIALALSAAHAGAAITVTHHYRMGESATAGTDSVGALTLTTTGTTTTVAGGTAGSTAAQDFVNGINVGTGESTAANYLDGPTAPTGSANWGVELWVNPDILPDGTSQLEVGLVHIGGTGGGLVVELGHHSSFGDGNVGWSIHRTGAGLTNHNAATGVTAPTVGVWTHLAYVSEGATATLYVNGTASSTAPNAGATGTGAPDMTIGSMWSDNRRGFDGQLDEVRLFTFNDGEFDINDTFVNGVPEPSSLALIGLAGLGLLRRRRK